jgi:5-methylthioribose kinase
MNEPKTLNLGLNKIDRSSPSTTYFDLDKYLDQNWEKIDESVATHDEVEMLRRVIGEIDIPDASLMVKGKTRLGNEINSSEQTVAATLNAVNLARQNAISTAASDATTKADTAQSNAKTYTDAKFDELDLWGAL